MLPRWLRGARAMRALVTGGSGFLGRQIVVALRMAGVEVAAPARRQADLLRDAGRQAAAAAGAELLVHAAWVTRPAEYWRSPDNVAWTAATIDLVRRFAAAGGRRAVLVGSCAEYDWASAAPGPWPESRPCRPQTPYGAAKLLAWTWLRGCGLSVANARVFWPVGLHEHPERLLPRLIRAAAGGPRLPVGPADLTRDLIDVRDAGAAVAALALSPVTGAVNIGAGQPVSLATLAALVAGPAPPPVRFGGRPLPQGEPLCMLPDTTRLRQEVGFTPRISLGRTLRDAAAHWQQPARAA